jgi:ABC-type sugar transport system permease subunit
VVLSLTDTSVRVAGLGRFIGLDNYLLLARDPIFWVAVRTTLVYSVLTTAIKVALAVPIALLLARPFPGRSLVFLAVFLPWVYPASLTTVAWYWSMSPPFAASYTVAIGQVANAVNRALGENTWPLLSVMLMSIWRGVSFFAIFLLAARNAVPSELFEYARLECEDAWRRLWLVTLPLLRPFVALGVLLSLAGTFADYTNTYMVSGSRVVAPTIGTLAHFSSLVGGRTGEGAAIALTMLPWIGLLLMLGYRYFERDER